jgi:hypothetical protein
VVDFAAALDFAIRARDSDWSNATRRLTQNVEVWDLLHQRAKVHHRRVAGSSLAIADRERTDAVRGR